MSADPLGRRALLAALAGGAASAAAGCSALRDDGAGRKPPARLPASAVRDVLTVASPTPERPVPVAPSRSAVRAGVDRAQELLASVPRDVARETVPNGVVREQIETDRARARTRRDRVHEAPTTYAALERTVSARHWAAKPAWTLRAATEGTGVASVRREAAAVSDAVDAAMDAVPGAGRDRDRTVYLAATLEADLLDARQDLADLDRRRERGALAVGEAAADVESASASVDVAEHLVARHHARTEDPRSFGPSLRRAVERSVTALRERDLPGEEERPGDVVDGAVSTEPAFEALRRTLWAVQDASGDVEAATDAGHHALALRRVYEAEVDVRAHDVIRERVASGDLVQADSPAPVRATRERAVDLARSVDPDGPSLPAALHASLVDVIVERDRDLRREAAEAGGFEPASAYAAYAVTAERLAALPDAVAAVEARFAP